MQALFFGAPPLDGSADAPLFGWFHPSSAARSADHAVLICSPWGREELSAHTSLRQWAIQLAEAGVPVLRFDYLGVGDSGGVSAAQSLDQWLDSVGQAIDELKRLAGVSRVCLLAVRLGATLAVLTAQHRHDVGGLVAVAPVLRGRAYIRELTALQMASATATTADDGGFFQSGGFAMLAATRDALSALDLQTSVTPFCSKVLVIDRDDLPTAKAWSDALAQNSTTDVDYLALPGFVSMMDDPHRAVLPQSMADASVEWLLRKVVSFEGVVSAAPTIDRSAVRLPATQQDSAVQEEALLMPGCPAFGILSSPSDSKAPPSEGILLLNAGSTRHIGPSRVYVELARHWASQGHAVLRLDLAGIGDADARPGMPCNQTYPPQAMDDIAAALHYLSGTVGVQRCHAVGLCAGAYHGLTAARRGMPLASLVLINPLVFFNAEGLSLDEDSSILSPQKINSAASSYQRSLVSSEKWLKLLKGQVHVGVLFQVMARRVVMRLERRWRDVARALRLSLKDDLGRELQALVRRGLLVSFVLASGDPSVALLREQGGVVVETMVRQKRLGLTKIDDADHVFTDVRARRELVAELNHLMNHFSKS